MQASLALGSIRHHDDQLTSCPLSTASVFVEHHFDIFPKKKNFPRGNVAGCLSIDGRV